MGFPRTPFLTVAENLPLYRQSQTARKLRAACVWDGRRLTCGRFSGSSARWAPSERFSDCSPGFSPAWNAPPFLSPRGDGLRTEDSVAAAGKTIHKKRKNFLIFLLTDRKGFGILSKQNKEG